MVKFLMVGLIMFFLVCSANAQFTHAVQSQYRFKYITVDEGLSNNNVKAICQDSKGFIWIATRNGINKFDGRTIVTYRNDSHDNSTISSNAVNSVFLDSKNNLWIATDAGLDRYNSDLDNFIRFLHQDINWPIGQTFEVVEDKDGKLWIAASTGLYAYNLNTEELQYFSNKADNPHGIPSTPIYRLLVDRNNNVWISLLNEGLCVYNQYDGTFKFYNNKPDDRSTISGNRIEILYEDSKGNIWAGTFNNGLNLYVPETDSFIRIIPDPDNYYSTRVRAIFEDLKGNFFIGTRSGLYILNNQTNEFVSYAYEGHSFSNLSENSIQGSFIDNSGTLWIGTYSGGVNYTNLNKKEFIHYKVGKDDDHFLHGTIIYSITEDMKGNLWVGGSDGLNYLDRTTHRFKYYVNNPDDPNSLSYNDIKSLEWDKKGNLWIGTNRGGLNYYDVIKGKFKSFKHDPDNPYSLSGDNIYGLMCDESNNLWIITNENTGNQYSNIDILPDGSDKFTHLNEKAFFGFDRDEKGDVYIGGINGFWIFSRKDSIFSFVTNDTLIGKVNTIRLDSKKGIWIGSNKGLVRYNIDDKSFISFSENNGYPVREVFGILEDDTKSLWVSTNMGLVKITNIVEDTSDIKIRVFNKEDGLQSKQFSYNAFYKSKTGELAFGGINGLNTFYPADIVDNLVPPNVVITDLIILNTSTPIGKEVAGRIILEKSISVTDEIKLGRKQNAFTLEFAALHYANPEKNTFKYKLEGFDPDWIFSDTKHTATYTNLDPGEYTFRVKGSNNDGVWNEEGTSLNIIIIPSFWQTWGFRITAIILLVSTIILIFYRRVQQVIKRNSMLEELVKERTKEIYEKNAILEEQTEELKTQRDDLDMSNSVKDKLFSIISHDLRSPFNTLNGFTELIKSKYDDYSDEKRKEMIGIISDSANQAYNLLDNLLNWSRTQRGKLSFNPLMTNVVSLINGKMDLLNHQAANKNILVEFECASEEIMLEIDTNLINVVIQNLLTNAIKFTRSNGKIQVNCKIEDNHIIISVRDNGTGISEDDIKKLFRKDVHFTSRGTDKEAGTGLGLLICMDFVEMHHGKIWLESELNKGSEFFISLPVTQT